MTQIPESPGWSRDTKRLVTIIALLVIVALVYIARPVIPQLVQRLLGRFGTLLESRSGAVALVRT